IPQRLSPFSECATWLDRLAASVTTSAISPHSSWSTGTRSAPNSISDCKEYTCRRHSRFERMTVYSRKRATLLFAGICIVLASQVAGEMQAQTPRGTEILVVVNPETPIANLSLMEVRQVFRGERQYWS